MNTHDPEELLRDTLRVKALDATAGLTLDDVRRDAAAQKRRTLWRTAGGLAAAAVVLVGVPTALYLSSGSPAPSPAPSPSFSPSVSPSPTATTSPTISGLASIPRGRDPRVTYLHEGVVHLSGGGRTRLPAGATNVVGFTPYHGGWLVLDAVDGLRQFDSTGTLVLDSRTGETGLAVSGDQLRTAFLVGGHLRVGIATGMGDAESDLPVGSDARLVGFLGDSVVLNAYPDSPHVVDPGTGRATLVPGLEIAWGASASGDLVGGTIDSDRQGRVVSMNSARPLWTGDWVPKAFSPDGSHVVAIPVSSINNPDDVAILDARTGKVVSQFSLATRDLVEAGPPVWEPGGDAVLFGVRETQGAQQAVLRLDLTGKVALATDPAPSNGDTPAWIFATMP